MSKQYYLRAVTGHELTITNQGQDLRIANDSLEKNALDALQGPKTQLRTKCQLFGNRGVKKDYHRINPWCPYLGYFEQSLSFLP